MQLIAKTAVVPAPFTPVVWWRRRTSKQEFSGKRCKYCDGEEVGVPGVQGRTHFVHRGSQEAFQRSDPSAGA